MEPNAKEYKFNKTIFLDKSYRKELRVSSKENPPDYSSDDYDNACSRNGVKKNIKYYLQNTTLHGLKYIAEDKITIQERVFFGLSFIGVVILSSFFISNIYEKWNATPIIISTNAKQTSISELPFPAITICNYNQAQRSKVQFISRSSSNYSLLMSLCDQDSSDFDISYVGTWKYFKAILIAVSQPCDEMLLYCSFGSQIENCSMIFKTTLTDDGLCCTFNALDTKFLLRNFSEENLLLPALENHHQPIDWTPERGYPTDLPPHYYPRVPGGTGLRMGLTVILNASSEEYFCSTTKCVGFKILVHNPAELPKISNYGILMSAGKEARIPIEPIYQDAVPSIRSIRKQVRRCLFSDEGDLLYYRTYSRKNCELECEAKILMERCSCVLYYLPLFNPDIRICGPKDNLCTDKVQSEIESSNASVSCDSCLPGCFELNYRTTMTSSNMIAKNFKTSEDFPPDIFNSSKKISDLSVIHFYYTSSMFRSTKKSEMFGFTEFLSNTGGLLGLFMGFSIFSIIEIVYYITVRPYCSVRSIELERKRKANEEKELMKKSLGKHRFSFKSRSKTWLSRSKKANEVYKNNLRDAFQISPSLGNYNTQVYPYVE